MLYRVIYGNLNNEGERTPPGNGSPWEVKPLEIGDGR